MTVEEYVRERQVAVRRFLDAPDARLLILRAEPEMEIYAAKVVASVEEDEATREVFFAGGGPFETPDQFLAAMADDIYASVEAFAAAAPDEQIPFRAPDPPRVAVHAPMPAEADFADYVERVARALRLCTGAAVVVLQASDVSDAAVFRASVEALATLSDTPLVKYIVLDGLKTPRLTGLRPVARRALSAAWPDTTEKQQAVARRFMADSACRVLVFPSSAQASLTAIADALREAGGAIGQRVLVVQTPSCPAPQVVLFHRALIGAIADTMAAQLGPDDRERLRQIEAQAQRDLLETDPESGFVEFCERLLLAFLPDEGDLVIAVRPTQVRFVDIVRASLQRVVDYASSPRIKYLLFDSGENVVPEYLVREIVCPELSFDLSPALLEETLKSKLSGGGLTSTELMRYTGALGGFAFSNKDYKRAAELQREWLRLAEEENSPADVANARYNLGNTLLAAGNPADASDQLHASAEAALDHSMQPLVAMAFTNLGVALFQLGRAAEALQCFMVGRDTFRALRHIPGEAHVLDCVAKLQADAGRIGAANQLWVQAMALYDGVSAEHLKEMKQAGLDDLRSKLAASEGR
jgi:tetratricopeptide (TPR) repeat protein